MTLLEKLSQGISPFVRRFVKRQNQLAVQIDHILEEKNWTQRQLAEAMGRKESYVSRLLSGNANPTLKTIVQLETALGEKLIEFPYLKSDISIDNETEILNRLEHD